MSEIIGAIYTPKAICGCCEASGLDKLFVDYFIPSILWSIVVLCFSCAFDAPPTEMNKSNLDNTHLIFMAPFSLYIKRACLGTNCYIEIWGK